MAKAVAVIARQWKAIAVGLFVLSLLGLNILRVVGFLWGIKTNGLEAVFPTVVIGPLGMDEGGRSVFCDAMDTLVQKKYGEGVRFRCTGRHVNTAMLVTENPNPITFGRLRTDEVIQEMGQNYTVLLQYFNLIPLMADQKTLRITSSVSVSEAAAKADKLGLKTAGDFWAACGFGRFFIRTDDDPKCDLVELSFSNYNYGKNPTVVLNFPRCPASDVQ
jgi:hypothetical protein